MDSPKPLATVRLSKQDLIGRSLVGSADASALGQADRLAAVGQLARGLAHEMNTPLGSISAHAEESIELLQDLQPSTQRLEDIRGHLLAIMRQAHRCSRIATRLLQFAQPAHALCESCRAEQVIGDVLKLFEPVAQAKGVRLNHSFEKDLSEAPIGPADLEQLLVNLVQNAIDACQSGDLVRVQARFREGQLELVIEDTGSGIPAEILSRIFDPFFTTKPVGQGTGLGLSVCHGIVGSVGGSIEVTSSPHAGTRVTIALPVEAGPALSAFDDADVHSNGGSSGRRSPYRWRNRYHNAICHSSLRRIVPAFFLLLSFALRSA